MNPYDDTKRIQVLMAFFLTFYLMLFSFKVNSSGLDCFESRVKKVCSKKNYDYEDELIAKYLVGFGEGKDDYKKNKDLDLGGFVRLIKGNWKRMNSSAEKAIELYEEVTVPLITDIYPELLIKTQKKIDGVKNPSYKKYRTFIRKVRKGIVKNIILSDLTSRLYNLKVEDQTNIYFAMAHPFYDAIFDMDFDDMPYSKGELALRVRKIISGEFHLEGLTKIEKLLIEITSQLYENIPGRNKDIFFRELKKLDNAQFLSMAQSKNPNLSKEELRSTIYKKGGLSYELYVLLADKDFSDKELDLFFILGVAMQNLDDIEDIEEDLGDHVKTLATEKLITPYEISIMVNMSFSLMEELVDQGKYDAEYIVKFKKLLQLFLVNAVKSYETYMNPELSFGQAMKKVIFFPVKIFGKTSFFLLSQFYPMIKEIHGTPKIKTLKKSQKAISL